jgi:hypothetical protein
MAKSKTTKAEKRWRNARAKRRLGDRGDEIWDVLKGVGRVDAIQMFTIEEKNKHFAKEKAFGTITCPFCGKSGILVENKLGVEGKKEDDYIARHNGKNSIMCDASRMHIQKLFKK